MDAAQLAQRARERAQFTHAVGAAQFTLRVPPRHQAEVAAAHFRGLPDDVATVRASRMLLEQAIVGWSGVLERHFDDELPEVEQPYSAAHVALLLDAQPAIEQALRAVFIEQCARRWQQLEDARKN